MPGTLSFTLEISKHAKEASALLQSPMTAEAEEEAQFMIHEPRATISMKDGRAICGTVDDRNPA